MNAHKNHLIFLLVKPFAPFFVVTIKTDGLFSAPPLTGETCTGRLFDTNDPPIKSSQGGESVTPI
jgi:hypothetical protein